MQVKLGFRLRLHGPSVHCAAGALSQAMGESVKHPGKRLLHGEPTLCWGKPGVDKATGELEGSRAVGKSRPERREEQGVEERTDLRARARLPPLVVMETRGGEGPGRVR